MFKKDKHNPFWIIIAIAEETTDNPAVTNILRATREYNVLFSLTRLSGKSKCFELRFYCNTETAQPIKKALNKMGIPFKTL